MSNMLDRVIDEIRRNRISTTEIADCLDKSGALERVRALNRGHFRVGPVFWTYAYNESNWELHEQIREAPAGAIILTEAIDCARRAVYGELVAKFLVLYRQAAAVVVQGLVRDAANLIRENYPMWMEDVTPVGCFNRKNEKPLDPRIIDERRAQYDGAIAVCDDTGVVVIPKENVNEEFLARLAWIEEQEDIWFNCIDRLKWDTFDAVCLKKYRDIDKKQ